MPELHAVRLSVIFLLLSESKAGLSYRTDDLFEKFWSEYFRGSLLAQNA
jgi:hypothetical protein